MKEQFISLVLSSFRKEVLKKLIFSRNTSGEVSKITCRLVLHRGRRLLVMESSLPGNTVSQKNVAEDALESELSAVLEVFKQANLLTALGDAEYRISKKGACVILGGDALERKLRGELPDFVCAIEALDKKKNYLLDGSEEFLIKLGISDKNGRVHDKRQGKFRQINKFLEHIEDIYRSLPKDGRIEIYDLCSGKSYLSFAVYYYLHEIKKRDIGMLCADLKRDVILWCEELSRELGYRGMHFYVGDIRTLPKTTAPDMVISLHACDIATDIVIDTAVRLGAKVILSTPCCHAYLNSRINSRALSFITEFPHLKGKLCEVLTDSVRLLRLKKSGYSVSAVELTDPENTPKNTLIRAIKDPRMTEEELSRLSSEYGELLGFILGENKKDYLNDI